MDSNDQKTLYITGNERIELVGDLFRTPDETDRRLRKEELAIIKYVHALYTFPGQKVVVPQMMSLPATMDQIVKVLNVFGDRENVTMFREYDNSNHEYKMMVVETRKGYDPMHATIRLPPFTF